MINWLFHLFYDYLFCDERDNQTFHHFKNSKSRFIFVSQCVLPDIRGPTGSMNCILGLIGPDCFFLSRRLWNREERWRLSTSNKTNGVHSRSLLRQSAKKKEKSRVIFRHCKIAKYYVIFLWHMQDILILGLEGSENMIYSITFLSIGYLSTKIFAK